MIAARDLIPKPANKLSVKEREKIVEVLNSPEYCDSSPAQIVPRLADQKIYLASESTFYRILGNLNMNRHRESSRPAVHKRPRAYIATGPNQVWSWDITYLRCESRAYSSIYIWSWTYTAVKLSSGRFMSVNPRNWERN